MVQSIRDAIVNRVDITGGGGSVESVTGLNTNNTDPANPVVQISVDGVTIVGDGTPGNPLEAVTGGGGTVTEVSVVSANGFAGTVADDTTTPAITLETTVEGIIQGNGTAISTAYAGTNYVAPLIPVIGLGDSIMAQNTLIAGASYRFPNGQMNVANQLLGNRLIWNTDLNLGANGNTTLGVLNQATDITNKVNEYSVRAAVIQVGINDVTGGVSSATIISRYTQIFDLVYRSLNLTMFVFPILPATGLSGGEQTIVDAVNAFLESYCADNVGLEFIDVYSSFNAATDTLDGIHPNIPGANILGTFLANSMRAYYSQGTWNYDAINLLPDEPFNGATGVNGTTNLVVTGDIPNGWYLAGPDVATASVTFSQNVDGSTRVVFSSTNHDVSSTLLLLLSVTGDYLPTDSVQGQLDAAIISATNAKTLGIMMFDNATSDYSVWGNAPLTDANFEPLPRGTIATDNYNPEASSTDLQLQLKAIVDSDGQTGSITFDVYNIGILKTPIVTNNAIPRFDSKTERLQNSLVTIDDDGNITTTGGHIVLENATQDITVFADGGAFGVVGMESGLGLTSIFATADNDGTDDNIIGLYASDDGAGNSTALLAGWVAGDNTFYVASSSEGTNPDKPISLAAGLTNVGQLVLNTDGTVDMSGDLTANNLSGTNTGDQTLNSLLPSQTGNSGKFLKTDGSNTSWDTAGGGSGDVVGPASSTDTAIAVFDGLTGKLLKNSVVTLDSSGNIITPGYVDADNVSSTTANIGTLSVGSAINADINTGYSGLTTADIGDTYKLYLSWEETAAANKLIGFKVNNGNRTIDLSGNLTVSSAATISGTNTGDQTLNGLLPSQTGNSGKFLKTDGSNTSWDTAGGSAAFNDLTSGTNTTAAMVVGTGGSLAVSGSGTIAATSSVNIGVTDDTTTNATMYPLWVTTTTGNLPAKISSTKMFFNPSTGLFSLLGNFAAQGTNCVIGASAPTIGSATLELNETVPLLSFYQSDGATNEKRWGWYSNGATFILEAANDANNSSTNAITITRSGTTISSIELAAPVTGTTTINATTGFKINNAASSGTLLRGNGTNYVATAVTYPDSVAQGDILYASASSTWAVLAKNTTATRALVNTGSANAPQWGQINLANCVTGTLPGGNGGTNNAFMDFTGPTTSLKTFTLPNATCTILTTNAVVTVAQGGIGVGTLTGIAKGNGTSAFTAATAGTDYVAPGTATTFTAQQVFGSQALTDAATITWNCATQQVANVLLTAGVGATRALGAPSNQVNGGTYILRVVQSSGGSNALTYNAVFKWPGGVAPVLSTAANAIDILTFVSDGTNMYGVIQKAFA